MTGWRARPDDTYEEVGRPDEASPHFVEPEEMIDDETGAPYFIEGEPEEEVDDDD